MAKNSTVYACSNCGYESPKWQGQCPSCKEYGTFEETSSLTAVMEGLQDVQAFSVKNIQDQKITRMPTGMAELDRVLGGGIVPAEVMLVSGDPGIGKSTLLLQLTSAMAAQGKSAVYVSAEESAGQVGMRAQRILQDNSDHLHIISAFEVNAILQKLQDLKPDLVVMDSIQTLYSQDSSSLPGSVSQIRTVASKLVTYAKQQGVATVIVGHITKQGTVAGPKLLEHLVDAVLQMEGDEKRGFRLLRSLKNRFGSTQEVGIFEMTEKGMIDVPDPSKYFVEESGAPRTGVCPAVIMEGNRALVIEVQALLVNTPYSLPKRVAEGISKSRLELLSAIVSKYARVDLGGKDIYVNIAGGIKIKDPAIDLAVIMAILSSLKGKAVPKSSVAFGEVALTGEVRKTVRDEQRRKEVTRLGYKPFPAKTGQKIAVSDLAKLF